MTYFEECISIWPAVGARWRTKANRSQTPTPRPHPGGAGSVWSHPSSATSPPTVFPAHIHNRCRQAAARPRPHDVVVRLDFGRPGCGEAAIVHCQNVFDRDQCFNPSIRILFDMTCQGYTKTIAQTKTITVAKPKLITSEGEVVKIPRLIRRLI